MGGPTFAPRLTIDRKPATGAGLLAACRRGDQRAWDALVERYGRLVYSIGRRYALDEADTDDVFQAVFVILFRRLETIRDEAKLPSWLITTTHRECWRVGRRSARSPLLVEHFDDVGTPDPDRALEWERQHLVRQALERLGGRCESLLTALFLDPAREGYGRIAERLGIPVGSIGPTRARCFRKLEPILHDLGLEPPETLQDP